METFILTDLTFNLKDFLHVFVAKSVKFGRTEVSIAPIDAKFQDLSLGKGPGPWFFVKYMICVKQLSIFVTFWGSKIQKKREIVDETGLDSLKIGNL